MKHTTIRMPTGLKSQVLARIKRDGYTERQKSVWVREAIHQLFEKDPGLQFVGVGDGLEPIDDRDVYRLDDEAQKLLKKGVEILRDQNPHIEGVQSLIIRAALRVRLEGNRSRKRVLL